MVLPERRKDEEDQEEEEEETTMPPRFFSLKFNLEFNCWALSCTSRSGSSSRKAHAIIPWCIFCLYGYPVACLKSTPENKIQ
jgi:hypothetical protein